MGKRTRDTGVAVDECWRRDHHVQSRVAWQREQGSSDRQLSTRLRWDLELASRAGPEASPNAVAERRNVGATRTSAPAKPHCQYTPSLGIKGREPTPTAQHLESSLLPAVIAEVSTNTIRPWSPAGALVEARRPWPPPWNSRLDRKSVV